MNYILFIIFITLVSCGQLSLNNGNENNNNDITEESTESKKSKSKKSSSSKSSPTNQTILTTALENSIESDIVTTTEDIVTTTEDPVIYVNSNSNVKSDIISESTIDPFVDQYTEIDQHEKTEMDNNAILINTDNNNTNTSETISSSTEPTILEPVSPLYTRLNPITNEMINGITQNGNTYKVIFPKVSAYDFWINNTEILKSGFNNYKNFCDCHFQSAFDVISVKEGQIILLAQYVDDNNGSPTGETKSILIAYNADTSIDTTFGSSGIVKVDTDAFPDRLHSDSNYIYITGRQINRVDHNGVVDTVFNNSVISSLNLQNDSFQSSSKASISDNGIYINGIYSNLEEGETRNSLFKISNSGAVIFEIVLDINAISHTAIPSFTYETTNGIFVAIKQYHNNTINSRIFKIHSDNGSLITSYGNNGETRLSNIGSLNLNFAKYIDLVNGVIRLYGKYAISDNGSYTEYSNFIYDIE